jgi:GNAT superfamily N-acetyltransferase
MITIRRMDHAEINRIGEVDRSETVEAVYLAERSPDGLGLRLQRARKDPPMRLRPWGQAEAERRMRLWKPGLEEGGVLLGAFDGEELVGFAILGPTRSDDSAELCGIFVAAGRRRRGIGSRLMAELENQARKRRIKALVIFSNPTASAVEFYLNEGCKLIGLAEKTLVKELNWDVVFAKELGGQET